MNNFQLNSTKNTEKKQEEILQEAKLNFLKKSSVKMANIFLDFDKKKGARMIDCAKVLLFKKFEQIEYRKLFKAFMCKILLCPFCMTRKSILIGNNLYKVLQFGADEKKLEYIHLTLALKNCKINELKDTIELMLKAFEKFRKRDIFQERRGGTIKGWFRNLEITFNQEDKTFHPHFHVILAVEKSYFFKETNPDKYLTQEVALQMWKECLAVDYLPTTDLRKVYYLDENGNKIINFDDGEGLKKAVEEASKYITKAMDLLSIEDEKLQKKVIKSMLQALSYRRLFAYGGILKNIRAELKLQDEEKSNLINLGDDEIDTTGMEYFVEVYKWCQENGGQYKKFVEMSEGEYKKLEKSMQDERNILRKMDILKLK
jgi:plasmid rolling circle replication initiator protein Rep